MKDKLSSLIPASVSSCLPSSLTTTKSQRSVSKSTNSSNCCTYVEPPSSIIFARHAPLHLKQLPRLSKWVHLHYSCSTLFLMMIVLVVLSTSQAASIMLRRPAQIDENTIHLLRRLADEYEAPIARSPNYILRIEPLESDNEQNDNGAREERISLINSIESHPSEASKTQKFGMKKRNNAEVVNHILKNFSNLGRLGDVGRR